VLEKNLDKLDLKVKNRRVTYHDACRLGRHMGVFDAPRNVLGAVEGLELRELNDSREASQCCGVSAWISCNTEAKALMVEKLDSAVSTGAEVLLTACPKCYAHLNCIKNEKPPIKEFDIEVVDLAVFLSKLDAGEEEENQ
jgi:Fe-S oxidoreductase